MQRVLFGVNCPIGPIVKTRLLKGPFWIHPPPAPLKVGISKPGMSLVSWVSCSMVIPKGEKVPVLLTLAPFPPNPCSGSQRGDVSQSPPASGVSRCQSLCSCQIVQSTLQNSPYQYGCAPVYPHSVRNAVSHRAIAYLCQGRNVPVPWMPLFIDLTKMKGFAFRASHPLKPRGMPMSIRIVSSC
jgi:hypothetical protein